MATATPAVELSKQSQAQGGASHLTARDRVSQRNGSHWRGSAHIASCQALHLVMRLFERLLVCLSSRSYIFEVSFRRLERRLERIILLDETAEQALRFGLMRGLHADPLGVELVEL